MKDNARQKLANPWLGMDYEERLEAAKAVDLRDNIIIKKSSHGKGYIEVFPIDETKLFKKGNTLNKTKTPHKQ